MVVMTDADYKPAFNASCSFPIIESIILEKIAQPLRLVHVGLFVCYFLI